MKYATKLLPENAFLKVRVGSHLRRVYFKDVKLYRKVVRGNHPPVPMFEEEVSWSKSTFTDCSCSDVQEGLEARNEDLDI